MINNKPITRFQLFFILIHAQIGVNVATLPHETFLIAQGDSWISIVLAGVLIQVMILIYGALMRRFPSYNFFEIIQILIGKWFGNIINFLIVLYFIVIGSIVLSRFSVLISIWMMPFTPKWVLALLVLLTTIYIATERLQVISSFFFLSSVVIIIYIVFGIYALKDANFTYVLPVGEAGITNIFKGVTSTLWTLHGFEFILFIYPLISSDHKGIIKTTSYVNICITIFYTFIVLASTLILSPDELKLIPEPVLYIFKSYTFKVIERPDLLMTSMWIILVVTTFTVIIYTSSLGLSVNFNMSRNKVLVCITAIAIYALSLTINGIYEVTKLAKAIIPFIAIFILIIPIMSLLLAIFMNKKECESNK